MKIVRALPALDILDDAPAPKAGVVLPFRKVTPKPAERYRTSVPLDARSRQRRARGRRSKTLSPSLTSPTPSG